MNLYTDWERFRTLLFLFEGRIYAYGKSGTTPQNNGAGGLFGGLDMQEVFVSLLVNEVRRGKHSVHTFEIVKEPEYNLTTTTEKEAS